MFADIQLTRDFRLSEWPCAEMMTPEQILGAAEVARTHLQPLRDRFGRIQITSGQYWRTGCAPRTGDHATPGTVDYVPLDAPLLEVFDFARSELPHTFGTLIYERNHIHRTPWGTRGKFGMAYREPREGVYELVQDAARVVAAHPFRRDVDRPGPRPAD